ncbi:MAG TPA: hypothetical protein VLJ11_10875 [Bryobacteraceae bacterium]|nr:hypothetical protein [Bryobacteraceae bacterium]
MLTEIVKFALVAVLLGHISPALAQSEVAESKGGQASRIEGTWIVTVDRINEGVTFTALQSFAGGGVALATGSIDRTPPPPISPLYGSWKRTGPNRVDVTINFFAFDPLGNAVAMIKNNETFHLDGPNELKGSGAAFACDPHGENCVSAGSPIRITGKRLIPEGVTEELSDVPPSQ